MSALEQKIGHLPTHPGVYLFKDKTGRVLYVGKAGNLRHRVASYFQKAEGKSSKTLALLEKVVDIETIVTDTDKEALILENHLIKAHRPRYNVKLRDDKTYPFLRLSVEDEFPTLSIVRRIRRDRSLYFGPYTSSTSLKETLRFIRKHFPIRTCLEAKFSTRLRPCLNYEMGRCLGPCCNKVDPTQYRRVVQQVKLFLEGKDKELIESLRKRMEEESEQLHFEAAAKIRDQIASIEHVIEKQKVVSRDLHDQDVIGFHRQDSTIIIHALFVRAGKLLGGKGFTLSSYGLPDEEVLSSFLRQYYREGRFIPERILIPMEIPEHSLTEEWLTELKGETVQILVPLKGDKRDLIKMASENAEKFSIRETEIEKDQETILKTLKERLHLKKIPRRIEAFDISTLQGSQAVGSMVCFENGQPAKDRYRHFKIRTIEGMDDYGMMFEVLSRRYGKEGDLPDLILIDGGRGQLNVAQEVLKDFQIKEVDLLGIAKERIKKLRSRSSIERTEEKIFHPQFREPFILGKGSSLLHFLDRIRDEAHRFAITYHQKVRKRETIKSELEEIPGVGEKRQKELLRYFGSVENIKRANLEALSKAPKVSQKLARTIYQFFHKGEKGS